MEMKILTYSDNLYILKQKPQFETMNIDTYLHLYLNSLTET